MKRAVLLTLFLALAAAAAYWVQGQHKGNLQEAWADALTRVGLNASVAPEKTAQATGDASARRSENQGGRRGGQGSQGNAGGGRGDGPRIAVVSAVAETKDLRIALSSVGWVEPIAIVTLRARIDSQILEQHAEDGQTVKRGDVLFRLDDREIQAQIARDQASLTRDLANQSKAEADLKRTQELLAKSIASQVQAEQYAADAKVAAANVAADRATLEADQIKFDYATVKAPISGRLGIIHFTEGNLVRGNDNTGDGLVTITQMKPLRVSFSLPDRNLDMLRAALSRKDPAPVRVYPSGSDQPLATGTLSFIDSSVDHSSGTITAKATFSNEDGRLWPGQYVRVEVDADTRNNATTVPLVAVQPGQDSSFAYVVNADKVVERRKVEVAARIGDVAAISSGIKPGEHVVVEGQMRLSDGSRVNETIASQSNPNRTAHAEETRKVQQ
jgi:multidrug efflux system membrane fusion protein